jgi:hypothetical protein
MIDIWMQKKPFDDFQIGLVCGSINQKNPFIPCSQRVAEFIHSKLKQKFKRVEFH